MSEKYKVIISITVLFLGIIAIAYLITLIQKPTPTNSLQQEQINLDSVKAYYNVKIDSVNTANLILKSKIKDKNEIIYTLKGLVNDNNKKYQVITDSALVVELERLRGLGIK